MAMKTKKTSDILKIVQNLQHSKKYRHICYETLYRIADTVTGRYKSSKEAIKAAKSKLHQIYGAYVSPRNLATIENLVNDHGNFHTTESLNNTCMKILELHSSTRERIPFLSEFYSDIFNVTGKTGTIIDLACGIHPFAIPWMGLPPETRYIAHDIDARLVNAINRYLNYMHMHETAEPRDILVSLPDMKADVIFLLKILPCLEQQEKHASARILRNLRASHVVVSFPTRSLGGTQKGMLQHYDAMMRKCIAELDTAVVNLEYGNEIVYILSFYNQ